MSKKKKRNKKYIPPVSKGVFSFYKRDMLIATYPRDLLPYDIDTAQQFIDAAPDMDVAKLEIVIDGYAFTEYHKKNEHIIPVWKDRMLPKATEKEYEIYDEIIDSGKQIISTITRQSLKKYLPYGHPLETYSGELSIKTQNEFDQAVKEFQSFTNFVDIAKTVTSNIKDLNDTLGYNKNSRDENLINKLSQLGIANPTAKEGATK